MKKKIIAGIVTAIALVAFAVPAFAAISDSQKSEVNGLLKQIAGLRKQVVQKYVDSGTLTKEQGEQIKKNIDQDTKYQEENGGIGTGYGCGGGNGMMGNQNLGTTGVNNSDTGLQPPVGEAI